MKYFILVTVFSRGAELMGDSAAKLKEKYNHKIMDSDYRPLMKKELLKLINDNNKKKSDLEQISVSYDSWNNGMTKEISLYLGSSFSQTPVISVIKLPVRGELGYLNLDFKNEEGKR